MDHIFDKINAFVEQPSKNAFSSFTVPNHLPIAQKIPCFTDRIGVLCFSKSRPFQLKHFIESFYKFCDSVESAKLIILYSSNDANKSAYDEIFRRFKDVIAIHEEEFYQDFLRCIDISKEWTQYGLIMFCVDDMVFTNKFSMSTSSCKLPTLLQFECKNEFKDIYLQFNYNESTHDWNYPFCLCGSIYRTSDIERLLKITVKNELKSNLRNPNILEYSCNKTFQSSKLSQIYTKACCHTYPVLTVVTVNRVQDTYDVPIYSTSTSKNIEKTLSLTSTSIYEGMLGTDLDLDTLNSYIVENNDDIVSMNLDKYSSDIRVCVHVGDMHLHLTHDVSSQEHQLQHQHQPAITVILPVHNGSRFLRECIRSLRQQTGWESCTSRGSGGGGGCCVIEVIIVIDGCDDDSEKIALQEAEAQSEGQSCESNSTGNSTSTSSDWMGITVISPGSRVGLSRALDMGLECVRSVYVARMDVDDVCECNRLRRQFDVMRARPDIQVLGGQVAIFTTTTETENETKTDSNSGSKGYVATEDYSLWFRILD
eukprot:gene8675-17908_t